MTVYEVYVSHIYEPTLEEVPDCKVTQEVWSLDPVELHKAYKIEVTSAIDTPVGFYYGSGDDKHYAETYRWNFIKIRIK